ncbi:Uncharacterised protein [[Clostridium] sordellii]|nr:Uncharacterised protein [[Clostridium] sordellii] [Paeniclostridium sordellii]
MKGVANMQNKRELYILDDCKTVEDVKELNRQRYRRWYQANREKKLAYAKDYREKYINKKNKSN